jgi:aldehyde dehydrogenase (NAD+)
MKRAARGVTDITLELGGKSPVVVYPDVDIDEAVDVATRAMFFNNGETCSAGTRLFVHEDIETAFVEAFVENAEQLTLGDPLDEETDLGPQVNPSQANKTMQYVESLREDGASVLTGGYEPSDGPLANGCFVAPTVVTDVDHDARGAQEEIFGPVASVVEFADYEEAITLANDVQYGLASAVATEDLSLAHRAAADIEAGTVWVNDYARFSPGLAFGGFKRSGIGRECGAETLDEYRQHKTVAIELE